MVHKTQEHERRYEYWTPIHIQNIKALEVSTQRLQSIQHIGQLTLDLVFKAPESNPGTW